MGHVIGGGFLKATTKEAALNEGYADAENFAYYNGDREEGSDNYHGNFRFYNRTFNNEDDAMEFFDSLGSYCDGIVIVKEASKSAKNKYQKTIMRIAAKQTALKQKAFESFKERTSETVGCKKCGHRISKDEAVQKKLKCPKCGKWLVSNTIQAKYDAYEEAKKQAAEQFAKDTADTGKPRYFAKYEIHC